MKEFGQKLKYAIELRRLTTTDVAEKLGCNRSLLYQYFSGKCIPRQDKLAKLASILQVNPDWFITNDAPMIESDNVAVYKKIVEKLKLLEVEELNSVYNVLCIMFKDKQQ